MRIGYLIDVHKGGYDQPMPTAADAHRTAVVVAHWLPLVEDLDQVFVIEDGRIVESGRPVELFTAGHVAFNRNIKRRQGN